MPWRWIFFVIQFLVRLFAFVFSMLTQTARGTRCGLGSAPLSKLIEFQLYLKLLSLIPVA